MALSVSSNDTTKRPKTYYAIEKQICSLKALGENVCQRHLVLLFKSKLLKTVMSRMEEYKNME